MGLDCSHDAFHGAYSAFNRFRQVVASAAGGSFPPHEEGFVEKYTREEGKLPNADWWYVGDGMEAETHPGLRLFMMHSDCDGELSPAECVLVANDLESLLPKIDEHGGGSRHIANQGGYGAVARKFIAGCREAAAAGEVLEFA